MMSLETGGRGMNENANDPNARYVTAKERREALARSWVSRRERLDFEKEKSRQSTKESLLRGLIYSGILAAGAGLLAGGVAAENVYNSSVGDKTVVCTVAKAEPGEGRARFRGTWSRVLIETPDCGTLALSEGVTAENRDAIAKELRAGKKYAFTVTASNALTWTVDEWLGHTHSVLAFEPTSGNEPQ